MLSAVLLSLGLLAQNDPVTEPVLERITLSNGATLEAQVVEALDTSLILDLGFTTLAVPTDSITARAPRSAEASPEAPAVTEDPAASEDQGTARETPLDADVPGADPYHGGALYRTVGATEQETLDDHVRAVGEAVVLVRSPVGLGSGFVVHPEGYVMTNDHVIAGSNELIVVVYRQASDGLRKDEYKKIRIVATSSLLDLALIKIEPEEPEEFVTVPLGDSSALSQGETVFAVGNPMGLERTLSEGIVGVRSRLLGGQTYVQITTPISPGNSGGPLFNLRGEVVGVNSLKIVTMGAEGLGFAIPSNRVKSFIDDQEAYAFDPLNANTGFEYYPPPTAEDAFEREDS